MYEQLSIVWTVYGQFPNHGQLSIDYGQLSIVWTLSIWTLSMHGQFIVHAWIVVHGPLWTTVHAWISIKLSMLDKSMYTRWKGRVRFGDVLQMPVLARLRSLCC